MMRMLLFLFLYSLLLSFAGFSLKIELVVFVFELIVYLRKIIFLLLGYVMIVFSMVQLGSFSDFQALQSMQMSLLMVLLTVFVQ